MRGHPDLHAKHVIADNAAGLLFTANLDGSHGLNAGIEVGTHLSKEASQHLAEWHDNLFESFPLELVYSPTSTDLAHRGGTKLLELNTTLLCSSKVHASVKDRISSIAELPVVLCKRDNRWILPETKRDRPKPKPYEPRVPIPSIKSGYLVGGLQMILDGNIVKAELANSTSYDLHHAHVKPGKYVIELIRPFTDDEVLEMIEVHLPAPEKGVVLKQIIGTLKEAASHPEFEIKFPLTPVGLTEYINKNTNKGLLRTHEIQGQKLMPVLSFVEAAELLKDILDSGDKEEMQKRLDKSKKPHSFTISNTLIKKLKKLLPDESEE